MVSMHVCTLCTCVIWRDSSGRVCVYIYIYTCEYSNNQEYVSSQTVKNSRFGPLLDVQPRHTTLQLQLHQQQLQPQLQLLQLQLPQVHYATPTQHYTTFRCATLHYALRLLHHYSTTPHCNTTTNPMHDTTPHCATTNTTLPLLQQLQQQQQQQQLQLQQPQQLQL